MLQHAGRSAIKTSMARYKLTIEYDGGPFCGWQRQLNGPSVQSVLEEATFRYCGQRVAAHASGRTDAGVHSFGQVAHIEIDREDEPHRVQGALNAHMRPAPVVVVACERAADDFHARFSCLGRSYLYRIVNRHAPLALEVGRAWQVKKPLDAEAMHHAAQVLVGHHDFTSFRAIECQSKSPVKSLDSLTVERHGELIEVRCAARSFLHHQVRNMVGTLALVGEGKWTADDVQAALDARDRAKAGPTAPADGLYFVAARY